MKEIVIKIPDETLNVLMEHDWNDKKIVTEEALRTLEDAFFDGEILPKGHGRLIDIDKAVENEETFRKYFSITTHPLMNGKIINCVAPSVVEADKGDTE